MTKNIKLDSAVVKFCRDNNIKGRTQQILIQLLVEGLSNKEMDEYLNFHTGRSSVVLHSIYKKLNISGRNFLFSELYRTALDMEMKEKVPVDEVFKNPVYNMYRSDDYVGSGTLDELSKLTGLSRKTLSDYRFHSRNNRGRKKLERVEYV